MPDTPTPFLLTVIFDERYGSLVEDFVRRVSDPEDPWYAKYMSREEMASYVDPSVAAISEVDAWLAAHGIRPAKAQTQNRLVRFFEASRAQIALTFGKQPARWLDDEDEVRAHRREWPIPRSIAGNVQQIQIVRGSARAQRWLEGTYWLQEAEPGTAPPTEDTKPKDLRGISPQDIESIYDFPAQHTGRGETIAILMLSHAPAISDLTGFWREQGIARHPNPEVVGQAPPPIHVVPIGPEPEASGGLGELEAAMVVEWAGAMAPGATIVVYVIDESQVADPWATFLLAVLGDTQRRPTVAMTSWLLPERQYYSAHGAKTITGLLAQCAAIGVTVLSATGDWGCFDSFPRTRDSEAHTVADAPWPHTVFPAVEEHVLAVGGTMITQRDPLTEMAWSGPLPVSLYGKLAFTTFAGGGGFSMDVPIPAWQKPFLKRPPDFHEKRAFSRGADVPAVLAYGRGIPDVALMSTSRAVLTQLSPAQARASGKQEDLTTLGYQALVKGRWIDYAGGTSTATPVWAAIIARINEARVQAVQGDREALVRALSDRMQALAETHDIADRPEVAYVLPDTVPPTHPALRRPLGFVNPLLYRVSFEEGEGPTAIDAQARAFRDIGVGNTDVTVRTVQKNHDGAFKAFNRRIPGYEACPGWDPVTGLGVPRVKALLMRCIEPTLLGQSVAQAIDWTGLGLLSSNTRAQVTSDTAPAPAAPAPEDDDA
ncbi:MAG: kumamolisin [Bradymonadia bacterium]